MLRRAGGSSFAVSNPPTSLCSRIESLTKAVMAKHGVPTRFWGPHSTRRAGVRLYHQLGLSVEQVCEIGRWKNLQAFTNHYLRVDSSEAVSSALSNLVHNVSPMESAEPEQSRTPRTEDSGGSDWEGVAQDIGEPTLSPLNFVGPVRSAFRSSRPSPYTSGAVTVCLA